MYSQQQQQQQQPKIPSYFISSTTMLEAQQIQPKQQRKDSNQVCKFWMKGI